MRRKSVFSPYASFLILPAASALLAVAIFILDTLTDLEIAAAVFYVVVVLLSVTFCRRRGILLVGAACVALTVLSYLLTSTGSPQAGLINAAISIVAIATITYLIIKTEASRMAADEARAQLAHMARVTTLGELTASIAHEVNQPLAAVVTNGDACTHWLAGPIPNVDEARQAIERIVNDASRASKIIGRVRELVKKAPPQKQLAGLNAIGLETATLMGNELLKKQISLELCFADDLPPILADPVQIQQVILNLILNAMEANLAVDAGERRVTLMSSVTHADEVCFEVLDTGKGLAGVDTKKIFEAFHTTKSDGMGMGLAIVRSIIEAHGGRVWAAENLPRGAAFRFALPYYRKMARRS